MPPAALTPAELNVSVDAATTSAPHFYAGALADPVALQAARDAVARYLGELGLAVNSRPAQTAIAACLDGAFGEVGPSVSPAELSRIALRNAALGMSRWLTELSDRGPTPPRHARLAARLSRGGVLAVPAVRRHEMIPQQFGR
ncbi:hypothetical protein [Alienimonas californiensis]|uniref:Uncharacterized protein n=1 Tax=Alienimonas californiensis TaxID=2527989 RepID=A0A517P4P0_9PLAN|nr:hypothetical protein [Alienimonas californiensis]QDT14340.1 hypothetical protein CA12_04120 [Alienimonas californiensis]